jgi:phospholipase D1/2
MVVFTFFFFQTILALFLPHQVLRSASQWSAGINTTEQSIHNAYINAICEAKHFIYVENQFFVSTGPGATPGTENQVADALFQRVLKAANNNEVFRVYVVMPLLPGFEGQVGTPGGTAIQVKIKKLKNLKKNGGRLVGDLEVFNYCTREHRLCIGY